MSLKATSATIPGDLPEKDADGEAELGDAARQRPGNII